MFIKKPVINPKVWDKPKFALLGLPRKFERPLPTDVSPDSVGMRPVLAPESRTLMLIMLIYQTRNGLMRVNFYFFFKERMGFNC
jgi:hypothetical protein